MNNTLAARLLPGENDLARNFVLAIAGSLIVAGAAQVSIPFWPVPMTLQTLAVLLVGGAFGARVGAAALVLYAFEGAIGLPFFAGGKSGMFDPRLDYLFPQPSIGYVVGFIAAAALIGYLAQSGWISSVIKMIWAAIMAHALIYVVGVAWLAVWYVATKGVGVSAAASSAIQYGLVPFIMGDLIKCVIAGMALASSWSNTKA